MDRLASPFPGGRRPRPGSDRGVEGESLQPPTSLRRLAWLPPLRSRFAARSTPRARPLGGRRCAPTSLRRLAWLPPLRAGVAEGSIASVSLGDERRDQAARCRNIDREAVATM